MIKSIFSQLQLRAGAHLEPALAAAQARKYVICEKPIEITLERIDAMIEAHNKAGTVLLEVKKRFHRIKGYRDLPILVEKLKEGVDQKEVVA